MKEVKVLRVNHYPQKNVDLGVVNTEYSDYYKRNEYCRVYQCVSLEDVITPLINTGYRIIHMYSDAHTHDHIIVFERDI